MFLTTKKIAKTLDINFQNSLFKFVVILWPRAVCHPKMADKAWSHGVRKANWYSRLMICKSIKSSYFCNLNLPRCKTIKKLKY